MPVTSLGRRGRPDAPSPAGPATSGPPRRIALLAVSIALAIGLSACEVTLESSPPSSGRQTVGPPASALISAVPFEPTSYPADGVAPCGQTEAPDPAHAAYAGSLKRIRATDARTVIFELCGPDVAFRSKVATPALAIQDTAWLRGRIPDQSILSQPNGTGPYRLDSWTRGTQVILTRNDRYWGEAGKPRAVAIVWDPDAGRRLAGLQAAAVDGIDAVAPADVPAVEANSDLVLLPRASLNTAYLGMSNRSTPFDDVRVREAIALAIDRRALAAATFPPGSQLATQFAPCAVPLGCAGSPWPEPDPSFAKDLLKAAGLGAGFTTTITYGDVETDYLPRPAALAEALRTQLASIGIQATIRALPGDAFLAEIDPGTSKGLFLLGLQARYPDATEFLDRTFGPRAPSRFGNSDRELTAAIAKGASTIDEGVRSAAYAAANDAILKRVPLIPLAHSGSTVAYRADVAGAVASPLRTELFGTMTPGDRGQVAWSQAAEPASLYCADETDVASLRVCAQFAESLYAYGAGDAKSVPSLAESCVPSGDLATWTCTLRSGVTFHDGSGLDAADVVNSFAVQWDADHPLHRGRLGEFRAFADRFRGFLNPPAG